MWLQVLLHVMACISPAPQAVAKDSKVKQNMGCLRHASMTAYVMWLQVYVINDTPEAISVEVKLYLLSLSDDPGTCGDTLGPEPWSRRKAQCHLLGTGAAGAAHAKAVAAEAGAVWVAEGAAAGAAAAGGAAGAWVTEGAAAAATTSQGKVEGAGRGGWKVLGCEQADVAAGAARLVWKASVEEVLQRVSGCSAKTCYVHAVASTTGVAPSDVRTSVGSSDVGESDHGGDRLGGAGGKRGGGKGVKGGSLVAQGSAWLVTFKEMELPDPELQVGNFEQVSPTAVRFTVSSKRVAFFAFWELGDGGGTVEELQGHFSENAVTVHPCMPVEVVFSGRHGVTAEELQGKLRVTSLRDHQQFGGTLSQENGQRRGSGGAARFNTPVGGDRGTQLAAS